MAILNDEMARLGGPAFPVVPPSESVFFSGMSLRDYFAAAALQGLCASFDGACLDDAFVSGVARRAFDIADAMLAARERKEVADEC
jgi:hypothetical protein